MIVPRLELDVLENKAVALLRDRLKSGTITVLNAKVDPNDKDIVLVDGSFEDEAGHFSKFEVKFRVKQENAEVVNWYVSG